MLPLMFGLNLSFLDVFLFLPKEGKARWWDFRFLLAKLSRRGMLMLRFCRAKAAREHGTQHAPPAREQQMQEFWRSPLQIRLRFNECSFYQLVTGPIVETHIADPVGQNQLRGAAC